MFLLICKVFNNNVYLFFFKKFNDSWSLRVLASKTRRVPGPWGTHLLGSSHFWPGFVESIQMPIALPPLGITSGMEAMTGVGTGADILARMALRGGEHRVEDSKDSGNGWDDKSSLKGNELRIWNTRILEKLLPQSSLCHYTLWAMLSATAACSLRLHIFAMT